MNSERQKCLRDPDAFPTFQLFLLAIVRLAEPIALTSIFPYAWALIKHFRIGDEEDASFYAGILISSFSLAEALMGMYWGGLSDRIGRKPVLLLGCTGTMFSMLAVGLAPNIWVALLGRAVGGFLNGNIGVIQTMVGEMVKKPEHEPRAYAIMPFVWSIGTIIGPAIGGTFADPQESFPNLFPAGGLFGRFPYLLPNLVCAFLLLVSIVMGYFLLDETHPDMQPPATTLPACPAHVHPHSDCVSTETPLLQTADAVKRPPVDLRPETYGTFNCGVDSVHHGDEGRTSLDRGHRRQFSVASTRSEDSSFVSEKKGAETIFTRRIMAVILSLSIFTYHSMVFDSTLPIFFEDERVVPFPETGSTGHGGLLSYLFYSPGGLGLSLRAVGMIMATNGAIALFIQAVVFPIAAAWVGVYRLFIAVTVLHPIAYLLVPALLYVPERLLYPAIYTCLTIRNLFGILVYPLLLILIKEAVPSASSLGKINGLAASAGAACRMVAPPIAGYLYTVGSRVDCTAVAWYSAALVAVIGSVQCFSVQRNNALAKSASSTTTTPSDNATV